MDKLVVQGFNSAYKEPLNCVQPSSFYINWEQNSTFQVQFTAVDDGSVAFQLLNSESSLFFDNQEYVIKQCVPDYSEGTDTVQITASHVYNESSRIWQRTVKTGTLTYSVNDILSFFFDNNKYGFTYKVIGNFDSQQIADLGNCSAKDGLSKIVETWPTATVFPYGRQICVYSADAWATDNGNRIDYINNTREIQLTYDSTEMVNQVMVHGATKDTDSGADDTDTTSDVEEYYFEPHIVQDDDSIYRWGERPGADVDDDRFTDSAAMDAYARTQLILDPSLSFDVTMNANEKPIPGEMRRTEIRKINYVTTVQVMAYTWYPTDVTQSTSLTMNNTSKSILDYQSNQKKKLAQVVQTQKDSASNISNDITVAKVGEIND